MQDRPTAQELLRAAREFCERELGPQLSGRMRFQVRVLQNVLGILEREWEQEEPAVAAEWSRLRALLDPQAVEPGSFAELREAVRGWNRDLAAKIRSGSLDDRWDEIFGSLRETTDDKIAIANPNYASSPD